VLVDWVENGKAPGDLEVAEQKIEAPAFATTRALPLCQWPAWPHYKSGPVEAASSFTCAP
jgi:feruloyl esterase